LASCVRVTTDRKFVHSFHYHKWQFCFRIAGPQIHEDDMRIDRDDGSGDANVDYLKSYLRCLL